MHEKSNYGYTSSGGWTFCELVDFGFVFMEGYMRVYDGIWRYMQVYMDI